MEDRDPHAWRTVRNSQELEVYLDFFDDLPLPNQELVKTEMLRFLEEYQHTLNALAAAQQVTTRRQGRRKRRRLS